MARVVGTVAEVCACWSVAWGGVRTSSSFISPLTLPAVQCRSGRASCETRPLLVPPGASMGIPGSDTPGSGGRGLGLAVPVSPPPSRAAPRHREQRGRGAQEGVASSARHARHLSDDPLGARLGREISQPATTMHSAHPSTCQHNPRPNPRPTLVAWSAESPCIPAKARSINPQSKYSRPASSSSPHFSDGEWHRSGVVGLYFLACAETA
jgi:hypothetical protein